MDRRGRGVPDPSIALNCGERLPTFGGGGGGAKGEGHGSSLKNTFYFSR